MTRAAMAMRGRADTLPYGPSGRERQMTTVFGVLGALTLLYWLYAINRPVYDRPELVRGLGFVAIPAVALVLFYLAGR